MAKRNRIWAVRRKGAANPALGIYIEREVTEEADGCLTGGSPLSSAVPLVRSGLPGSASRMLLGTMVSASPRFHAGQVTASGAFSSVLPVLVSSLFPSQC